LFAYNHADWYVDLVLDLAVRYDRIAPGEPIPEVLGIGPPADAGTPMHYAAGRDLRLQSRPRRMDDGTSWLGVPWHGRAPGAPISPAALEDTALEMVRGAFGLSGRLPKRSSPDAEGYGDLADRAWAGGLLPMPDQQSTPTIEAIRAHLERGQPVVALLDSKALPGHPPSDQGGDQPVVVIGTTAAGLIVSDPTFSSTLGYGLHLTEAEFLAAWKSASSPGRALAFSVRPTPLARQAHVRAAEPPPLFARVFPTPTMTPTASPTVTPVPTPSPAPILVATATPVPVAAPRVENSADLSWLAFAGPALFVAAAFVVRLARARRWAWPPGRAATARRRSGQ
jgi:hypothetical protein